MSSQTSECGCDSTAHNLMTIDKQMSLLMNQLIKS